MQSLPLSGCALLDGMDEDEAARISNRIAAAKRHLGDKVMILGHHYQRDSIIKHADETGDSFMLSRKAADATATNIVFCGVHFMAESADILTSDEQTVMMPNIRAGCSMADMADLSDVSACWSEVLIQCGLADPCEREDADAPAAAGESFLVPVTYMNSGADLKAFVGRHGGVVCTSSNAAEVVEWALIRAGENGKVLFFPDQHLGRNTAISLGYDDSDMAVWNPMASPDWKAIVDARFLLWHGYCSVHQRFTTDQVRELREADPEALVIAHPECCREVVEAADAAGSTEMIRRFVDEAPSGTTIGVATEIHLVQRLDAQYPDKRVICLDPEVCPCSTMYMIHPALLADLLERIVDGEVTNVIEVAEDVQQDALTALRRMLDLPA